MSLSIDSAPEFGAWRSFFWPIHGYELRKVLPMVLMLVLIGFNYRILYNLKDSLVITTSGAEVIPFIKMWVLLPMAIVLTVVFARLTNKYSQERVFYIMVSIFLVFFAIFTFFLYPFREILQPHDIARDLQANYPSFKWFIAICDNWIFTSFYVMSELWGTIVLQVIFWGFANEITRVDEARRFYSIFSIGGNLASVLAGMYLIFFISSDSIFDLNLQTALEIEEIKEADWMHKLQWIMGIIIACGIGIMALFHWTNKHVLNDPCFDGLHKIKKVAKLKGRQSLRESFKYLKNSKYLVCIAVLVISYNLTINLVEIVWKDQLKQLYPAKADYLWFMSCVSLSMGIVSTITAFFMSHMIARFGWTFTALITPVTMMVTSIGFFTFLLFRESLAPMAVVLVGTTPLAIAVYIGSVQNCFSKAAKYSVFDATKEMAFIPLDHESKLKGKAAIDGIGSRLGKSGGSLIHTGLLMIFHTLSNSSPYVAAILLIVILGWTIAVSSLGKKFNELTSTKPTENEESEPKAALATAQLVEG
ncbi:MAG: NTP/NDP exchange transporter [Parachlamydiaceae bacterium]|nr:NTP/NDP exchange transporter [Parachlamydiaceae bacterium]